MIEKSTLRKEGKYRKKREWKSNYPGFHRALTIDFKYIQPETKEELKIRMMDLRYHLVKDEKKTPTDKQVNHAWDFIQNNLVQKQRELPKDIWYERNVYNKHYVFRATTEVLFEGKKYRKGQFLPRRLKNE